MKGDSSSLQATPLTLGEAVEFGRVFRLLHRPKLRTMRQFAEEEVVLPEGPFSGRKFRCDRQPFTKHWFDLVDSGQWNRHFATGPSQSGKTLAAFVTPILYHLFEMREPVIVGLPSMDMATDKWNDEIRPAIETSRYVSLLPYKGAGSRGGTPTRITFDNGSVLKFMSAGGSDKKRAGKTSRVLVMTEIDGFDEAGGTSREGDKISQLEARTQAYGSRKCVYGECTVSIEEGRTWQEYKQGTESRIVLQCPCCSSWVTPEREHFRGYEDAGSVVEAQQQSQFYCPECSEPWTDEQRTEANATSRVVHRGQEVTPEGEIVGKLPETNTLGFRWSAVNNLFLQPADIAEAEYRGKQEEDEDNATKRLNQFVWAVPYKPDKEDEHQLLWDDIIRRQHSFGRGIIPEDCEHLTIGMDVGKWLAWFSVKAWTSQGASYVIDYGSIDVPTAELGIEKAIKAALNTFLDSWEEESGRKSDLTFIDSRFEGKTIESVCSGRPLVFPIIGLGQSSPNGRYVRPKKKGAFIRDIGEEYHIERERQARTERVKINVDYWKTQVHKRLTSPPDARYAIHLPSGSMKQHLLYAKHVTAEKRVSEYVPGKGVVEKWVQVHRNNHLFDCEVYSSTAGAMLGHTTLEKGDRGFIEPPKGKKWSEMARGKM